MNAGMQRPHDKLFRSVFADPHEAASFLRLHLPPALAERLDWSSLTLEETSFVDEALQESESDLLYTVRAQETEQVSHLYVLFEHQSSPDKWMRFRLLKYMCRIWDASFKQHPEQKELRAIIPLVFYQGEQRWRYATEFAELFGEGERGYAFLPHFVHYLVDQSDLPAEQTQGGLKARVAQLLLMAAVQRSARVALSYAAQLVAQVAQGGGVNYLEVFVVYLAATQERQVVEAFVAQVGQYTVDMGGDMVTYAEELKQEGWQKGRQEGEIETIERLLAVGVEWTLITRATGITPSQFQALKAQLQLRSSSADADREID